MRVGWLDEAIGLPANDVDRVRALNPMDADQVCRTLAGSPAGRSACLADGLSRRARRWSLLFGVVCLWALPPSAARARPAAVYFEWERPLGSTCPPAAVLERDVEQALERRVFTSARNAPLRVVGEIDEQRSEVVVHLEAVRRDGLVLGTRELRAAGSTCAALRSDIVLVLILLVEHEAMSVEPAALRFSVGVSAALLGHVLPRWTVGVGPAFALDVGDAIQLRADLAYWLPLTIQTAGGIRAELHGASVALRGCPRLWGGYEHGWSVSACAGIQLGALIVAQDEPPGTRPHLRSWVQGLAGLRAAARLWGGAQLGLSMGPVLSITRTSLYAAYGDRIERQLYRLPLLGFMAGLGMTF